MTSTRLPRICAAPSAKSGEAASKIGALLPAMGYSAAQMAELEATIAACNADLVLTATPIDLRRVIKVAAPLLRVRYELQIIGAPTLADLLAEKFGRKQP